jgi:hypothetical protein
LCTASQRSEVSGIEVDDALEMAKRAELRGRRSLGSGLMAPTLRTLSHQSPITDVHSRLQGAAEQHGRNQECDHGSPRWLVDGPCSCDTCRVGAACGGHTRRRTDALFSLSSLSRCAPWALQLGRARANQCDERAWQGTSSTSEVNPGLPIWALT